MGNRLTKKATTYTYVYGHGLISQTDASGVQSYFLANGLGSTEALTDGSGNIIGTYKYDVFGAVRSSSGSGSTEYRFTGQQDDATLGYTYLRARYYDPAVGRFPSKDLVPAPLQRPQAINDYVYVADDPANLADPSGLWCPRNLEDCKDLIPRPDKEIKRAWNFWTKTVPDVASKGYVDVGVTICYWGCGTFGAQFGRGQGFHPYFGGGIGSPGGGLAVNLLPYQSISQVWSCGLGGGYAIFPEPVGVGWGGEAGFSGISFKGSWPFIEGSFYAASGPFVGLSGISGTLYYVFPEPW
ncbi:MAG: RHS repeat-associated core domain-containing protein [Chloroflexi bacterium]|nr:RHS repeat-associated core domain-containing protein [Chloroflexota bacterium]